MTRVENLLTETLRDPERGLPAWADPVTRIRRARAAETRRRLVAAVSVAALVAVAAVAVPMLRGDRTRGSQPTGVVEQAPVAVVAGRIPADEEQFTAVFASNGRADVATRSAQGGRVWLSRVEEVDRRLLASPLPFGDDPGADGRGAGRAGVAEIVSVVRVGSHVWAVGGDERASGTYLLRLDGADGWYALPKRGFDADLAIIELVGGAAADVYVLSLRATGPVVTRRAASTGRVLAEQALGGRGAGGVAFDGESVWTRVVDLGPAGDPDGSSLVRLDGMTLAETGRAKLPGSLTEGAIVAGGGSVWASVASTSVVMTTAGGVVAVDIETLAVGEVVDTPFALELGYADGSVWLRGEGLARIDAETGRLRGEPIDLDGRTTDMAVDGRYVWVVGSEGLTRYDTRYDDRRL